MKHEIKHTILNVEESIIFLSCFHDEFVETVVVDMLRYPLICINENSIQCYS